MTMRLEGKTSGVLLLLVRLEHRRDHWKATDILEPWAGWSSVSWRRRSGSPVRYSTGSGAHDGSVQLPAAMWCASPDPSDRRVRSRAAEGSTYLLSHTVSSTGTLVPGCDAVLQSSSCRSHRHHRRQDDIALAYILGPPVTRFHRSRDLSSSARRGFGGASLTFGALTSTPSAGVLAHHRTCLRRSTLGYSSAGRLDRAPYYLWSTVSESRSVVASLQKATPPRTLECQLLLSNPTDVAFSPAPTPLHLDYPKCLQRRGQRGRRRGLPVSIATGAGPRFGATSPPSHAA